jgi:hypothetical protein
MDSNSIKFYFKLCAFSCMNGTILDIIFKFNIELNMQLIHTCFYASRKKWWLTNQVKILMCKSVTLSILQIETFYIDFLFFFFFSLLVVFINFINIFIKNFYNFLLSWNVVFRLYMKPKLKWPKWSKWSKWSK